MGGTQETIVKYKLSEFLECVLKQEDVVAFLRHCLGAVKYSPWSFDNPVQQNNTKHTKTSTYGNYENLDINTYKLYS